MVAPLALLGLSVATDLIGGAAKSIGNALGGTGKDATRKTAKDFETMFLESSLGTLTANAGEDGPLGDNGTGGATYRQMLQMQESARAGG